MKYTETNYATLSCKRILDHAKKVLQKNYPSLLDRAHLVRGVVNHLLSGKQVMVSVNFYNGDSHYDYVFDAEVRQSKRSPNKWAYVPRNLPKGDYTVAVRHK